jgi:mono/diheme cytochrome c family protein
MLAAARHGLIEAGFGAATASHPRPYGMPPFGQGLNDGEIAAKATWLRQVGPGKAPAGLSLAVPQRS